MIDARVPLEQARVLKSTMSVNESVKAITDYLRSRNAKHLDTRDSVVSAELGSRLKLAFFGVRPNASPTWLPVKVTAEVDDEDEGVSVLLSISSNEMRTLLGRMSFLDSAYETLFRDILDATLTAVDGRLEAR